MSDYSRAHDFSTKTGTAIFGSEVDDEFDALVTAVNSKVDESREASANGIATLGAGSLIPAGISGTPTSGGGQMPEASLTALGAVELATTAEATALTDALRAITPSTLNDVLAVADGDGIVYTSGVFDLKPSTLTAVTIAAADTIPFSDSSDTDAAKKTTFANFEAALNIANLSGYVANSFIDHSGVSITAGAGLTGGGTIAATRTLDVGAGTGIAVNANDVALDPSGLATLDIETVAGGDSFLIYDTSAGVTKLLAIRQGGSIIAASSTKTINADGEVNQIYVNSGASNHTMTIEAEATKDYPIGTEIGFICNSTGTITLAINGADSIISIDSNKTVKPSGGGAYIVKTAAGTWSLIGDLQ